MKMFNPFIYKHILRPNLSALTLESGPRVSAAAEVIGALK